MARKKLNKKVAIIGLAVLAAIGTLIIFVMLATRVPEILGFAPGPDKFIDDGDRALAANDYKQAESDYIKALKRAKTDALKIEIIFKLVDVYLNNQDWKNAMACWEKIIQIKPSEYRTRLELLSFYYVYADTGVPGHWQTVTSRAKDFLDYIDKSVYSEPLPELKSFDKREKPVASRIGCYVYLLKGRANYEIARRGMTAGLEEMYDQAINDLQTAKELEPDNVNIYRLLSQAITSRGNYLDSKGNLEAKQKAAVEAMQLLEECLTKSKDKVQAEINIVSKKLANADEKGLDAIKLLEPEFLSLSNKYSSVAEVQARTAEYYLLTGPKGIDKVVEYIEKAMALDKENIVYTLAASTMYYYQFAIHDRESFDIFRKAVEMARKATELPDAQDIPAPEAGET